MKSPAGVRIDRELKERGWTQGILAEILDRPRTAVSQIISGKKQITAETAIQLAAVFDGKPIDWMVMDCEQQLRVASHLDVSEILKRAEVYNRVPVKELQKRSWIPSGITIEETEQHVEAFVASNLSIFTKRTSENKLNSSQLSWCYRAAQIARDIPVPKFSQSNFEGGICELRNLTTWPEEARKAPAILTEMGVKFVVVEPLPKTRIDGATFWLDGSPVVCLSLRFNRIDSFWHTLGHELSHVRHRDSLSIDTNIFGEDRDDIENEIETRADREGAEMWIDPKEIDDFILRVSPFFEQKKINGFASRIKVHPGIIVGQLQHRGAITYATYRKSLAKVRDIVTSSAVTDGWGHTISN